MAWWLSSTRALCALLNASWSKFWFQGFFASHSLDFLTHCASMLLTASAYVIKKELPSIFITPHIIFHTRVLPLAGALLCFQKVFWRGVIIHSKGAQCMLLVSPWLLGTAYVSTQITLPVPFRKFPSKRTNSLRKFPSLAWIVSHSGSRQSSRNAVRSWGSREGSSHFVSCQLHSCIFLSVRFLHLEPLIFRGLFFEGLVLILNKPHEDEDEGQWNMRKPRQEEFLKAQYSFPSIA